nr:MAG TPA: hypothetical protein [Caudoviricetes sp.]
MGRFFFKGLIMVFEYKRPVPKVRYIGIRLIRTSENTDKEVHAYEVNGTAYVGASADKHVALEEILNLLGLTHYSLVEEEDKR